jgi:predicted enzyme related to lactoylglutathione lyase
MKTLHHPVVYFEIPVTDMNRAMAFYTAVFDVEFEKEYIDGNDMALFPLTNNQSGISGALVKGDIYNPTQDGILIYFHTENIEQTLQQASAHGSTTLFPKTSNGEWGYVAEFQDSEGNRIGLHEPLT